MSTHSAKQVTDWFLSRINTEAGDTISPLKLQKLIYYAQAWHLAIFETPLFDEKIEAWMHGPVVVSQYQRFQEICRDCVIDVDKIELEVADFTPEVEQLLSEVHAIYGEHSASYLEALTHQEMPWISSRNGLPEYARCNNEITHESMKTFYKRLNNGQ
jgi:uncharacterized phage-associated protein